MGLSVHDAILSVSNDIEIFSLVLNNRKHIFLSPPAPNLNEIDYKANIFQKFGRYFTSKIPRKHKKG